jgi:hypothetical protein
MVDNRGERPGAGLCEVVRDFVIAGQLRVNCLRGLLVAAAVELALAAESSGARAGARTSARAESFGGRHDTGITICTIVN